MQQHADQAADQGAVEADVLQVAAHAEFQLLDQLALVPGLERLRDVRGHAAAQARGEAFGAGQHVLVERIAQRRVAADGGAELAEVAFKVRGQHRILARQVVAQLLVDALPQALHVVLHGRMVDHLLLERVHPRGQCGIVAQPLQVAAQPACVVLAQRMPGFGQDRLQFVQPGAGHALGERIADLVDRFDPVHGAGQLRPFLADVAHDQRRGALAHGVAVEPAGDAGQALVQHPLVAVVGGQQAEQVAGGGRGVPLPQLFDHEALDGPAHGRFIQQVQRLQCPAACHAGQHPRLLRLRQPVAQARGRVEDLQLGQQRLRLEEVVAHEQRQAVGDARLAARDDGGMRDRQVQRAAEQRHHREPVGQCADHGRLAERADPRPGAVPAIEVAEDEAGQHRQQHRQRVPLEPAQLGAARIGRRHAQSLSPALRRKQCGPAGCAHCPACGRRQRARRWPLSVAKSAHSS